MISVNELIEELKLEDPKNIVRRAHIFFGDSDRIVVIRDHVVHSLRATKEAKDKLKEIK
mgnify:CR=1 FL=1